MLGNIQSIIKIRALIVVMIIHAGLALGIFALARQTYPNSWDLTSTIFAAAVGCLYGGFMLGVVFVLVPLLPWLKRAATVEHWSERIVRDVLPPLLEQLPKLVAVAQSVVVVWNEAKAGKRPVQDLIRET